MSDFHFYFLYEQAEKLNVPRHEESQKTSKNSAIIV